MTSAALLRLAGLAIAFAAVPGASARADNATPVATVRNLDVDAHIDIVSLKRTENNTVTLQFVLVNDSPGTWEPRC